MNKDGVSAAFALILEEISAVESQLTAEGASAFRDSKYDTARKLSDAGKRLVEFRTKLANLQREWQSEVDIKVRERVRVDPAYTVTQHSKNKSTRLRVTLPSGLVFQRPTAASTFADVIEELGLEEVSRLGFKLNRLPLVDTRLHSRYAQERRGSFFIATHSSTKAKQQVLERIANALGRSIKVEIVR